MPGLLLEKNGQQLIEEETRQAESGGKREQFESNLAMYIRNVWDRNKRAKVDIEQRMIKSLRQRNGEYDPQKLALIKLTEGSEIFSMLTYIKCKAAEAWLSEAYSPIRGKCWALTHTPIPDLSPDILQKIGSRVLDQIAIAAQVYQEESGVEVTPDEFNQVAQLHFAELKEQIDKAIKDEAKKAIGKMSEKIDDQLTEGHWERNFKDVRSDLITLGTGLLKGPTARKRNSLMWSQSPEGEWILDMADSIVFEYDRLSPLDAYPEDDAEHIQDGDFIEYMRLSKDDLGACIGMKGFNGKYIKSVLKETKYGSKTERLAVDQQRSDVEGRQGNFDNPNRIDVLNYWGNVPGDLLLEWGMDESQIPDPDFNYNINAWLVVGTQYVVKAVLNITGVKPYSKACFEKIPGAFWGRSLPEIVRDDQDMCNATARAIQNNQGMCSLPIWEIDIDKMVDGSNSDKLWAGRGFQTNSKGMNSSPAVRFYQPNSVVGELLAVYEKFSRGMDEKSGIPAFAHGDPKTGGSGNALANYEKVLTSEGAIKIEDIKAGQLISNTYGGFSVVTGVFPQGESDIFRFKFGNGEHIDCDLNHRWSVRTHNDRPFRTLTTADIISKGLFGIKKKNYRNPTGQRAKWMIPIIDCVEFSERKVKIDPYTMGYLISNGDSRCRITGMDKEVFDRIPYPLGKIDRKGNNKAWSRTIMGIKEIYHSYGLECKSIEKFIPEDYLFNMKIIRLELLLGLMDGDGCCSKQGEVFFQSSSYRLAKDFIKLVRSLGGIVSGISTYPAAYRDFGRGDCYCKESYRVVFNLPGEKIFHLRRKQDRVRLIPRTHTYITGVEYIGKFPSTCIEVDSKDKLFVCENFIPTHNTASGLSIFVSLAGKIINDLTHTIDMDIVATTIERTYNHNMMYDPNPEIKRDAKVVVRGTSSLVVKEQEEIRKSELLRDTNNPVDLQIMGLDGRKELLKDKLKTMTSLDMDKIIPEVPIQFFPANVKGKVPLEKEVTRDVAGNPSGGTDFNQFKETSQRGGM